MNPKKLCENCKWFEIVAHNICFCHLNPPVPIFYDGVLESEYSEVEPSDWCSHWEFNIEIVINEL